MNSVIPEAGWLEYFVEGLTTKLAEVREHGEQGIRRDMLVKKHDFVGLDCPSVSRCNKAVSISPTSVNRNRTPEG